MALPLNVKDPITDENGEFTEEGKQVVAHIVGLIRDLAAQTPDPAATRDEYVRHLRAALTARYGGAQ